MKRITAFLLAVIMCLSLAACNANAEKNNTDTTISGDSSANETPIIDSETEEKYTYTIEWLEKDYYNYKYLDSDNKNDILGHIYNFLGSLGDYKESKEYLERFNVFSDKLLTITKVETDDFGQKTEVGYKTYSYNEKGESYMDTELFKLFDRLGIYTTSEKVFVCEYDDNGIMTGAQFYSDENEGNIKYKLQIEYDTNGNIIKANFQENNGTSWTNEFSYDEENHLIEKSIDSLVACFGGGVNGNYPFEEYPYYRPKHIIKYKYDSVGNIIEESYTNKNKYDDNEMTPYTIKYTYDENGLLLDSSYFKFYDNEPVLYEKKTYLYNENNCISSVEVSYKNSSHTLVYNYGDYYFYNKNN